MATIVDICNIALSNIRAGNINSLTEGSLQAQQCALKYPFVRDKVLAEAPFGFNKRIEPMAVLNDDVFNWGYSYQYPADCLYIDRLILNIEMNTASPNSNLRSRQLEEYYRPDLNRQVEYDVISVAGNRVIVSNESDLRIQYRARVDDPNVFGIDVTFAIAYFLAAEIAIPIIGVDSGMAMQKSSYQLYMSHLSSAISAARNEQYSPPVESDFITVRN